MAHEVHEAVGVAPLVVVPGQDLHKGVVEHDSAGRVDDGRVSVMDKVGGDHIVLGEAHDALERALGLGPERGHDGGVVGGSGQLHSEVHNRHVDRRNS